MSLSEPVPAGAFLAVPGIGGTTVLVAQLAALAPGSKRTLTALELRAMPSIAISAVRYEVERKPDAAGHRVFILSSAQRGTSELVVDGAGTVLSQTFAPPDGTTITLR